MSSVAWRLACGEVAAAPEKPAESPRVVAFVADAT